MAPRSLSPASANTLVSFSRSLSRSLSLVHAPPIVAERQRTSLPLAWFATNSELHGPSPVEASIREILAPESQKPCIKGIQPVTPCN